MSIIIMGYLSVHQDVTFTADEISATSLGVHGRRIAAQEMINPLRNLVNVREVEIKEIAS